MNRQYSNFPLTDLNLAIQQMANLKQQFETSDHISIDVSGLINTLNKCDSAVNDYAFTQSTNPEEVRMVQAFLSATESFPFHLVEKSTIEKINGLQIGIFSTLSKKIKNLKTKLKKYGLRVEKAHDSSGTHNY